MFFKYPTATEKVDGSVRKVNEVTESLGPQKPRVDCCIIRSNKG